MCACFGERKEGRKMRTNKYVKNYTRTKKKTLPIDRNTFSENVIKLLKVRSMLFP